MGTSEGRDVVLVQHHTTRPWHSAHYIVWGSVVDAATCCPDLHFRTKAFIPSDAASLSCNSSLPDPITGSCRTEALSLAQPTPELPVGLAKASVANSSPFNPF